MAFTDGRVRVGCAMSGGYNALEAQKIAWIGEHLLERRSGVAIPHSNKAVVTISSHVMCEKQQNVINSKVTTFYNRPLSNPIFSVAPNLNGTDDVDISDDTELACLQWLTANEIRPSADLSWDTLLPGKLLTHASGEELSSLDTD
jgi:hypothetical protein